jgi:hypothetical protein
MVAALMMRVAVVKPGDRRRCMGHTHSTLQSKLHFIRIVVTLIVALAVLTALPVAHSAKPAGAISVRIGPNIHVSKARSSSIHGEVILAADPNNPARLLAGSKIYDQALHVSTIAYASFDSGKTWTISLDAGYKRGHSDPSVAYGPDGLAYFADIESLSLVNVSNRKIGRLFRSSDGGKSWAKPVYLSPTADREFIAADNTRGKYRGRLYWDCNIQAVPLPGTHDFNSAAATSAIGLYFSPDGGRHFHPLTFDAARVAYPPFRANACGNCVVLSDGTVVDLYHFEDPRNFAQKGDVETTFISTLRSHDGGLSFEETAGKIGWWYSKRREDEFWIGASLPIMAADPGSPAFRDHLYVVWADAHASGYQVMFSASNDGGRNWSEPVAISDLPTGEERQHEAFLPVVAVNNEGLVGVCWYDSRDIPAGKRGWNYYFRASLDGGKSWSSVFRVSAVSSLITHRKGNVEDTTGLAADRNGVFHALWIDNRTGVDQVWTSSITVATGPQRRN